MNIDYQAPAIEEVCTSSAGVLCASPTEAAMECVGREEFEW